MKKRIILAAALAALLPTLTLADEFASVDQPISTPGVQVAEFYILSTPTPVPPPAPTPKPIISYIDHGLTQDIIDEQAAIFWADCNTDAEKQAYACVAVNRFVYGGMFGDNLKDILHAKSEWNHGHVSNANREKANEYLNKALTQYQDGVYAGLDVPSNALYVKRDKEQKALILMDKTMVEVFRIAY